MNNKPLYTVIAISVVALALLMGAAYWLYTDIKGSADEIMSDKARQILAERQAKELDAFAKTYQARKPELDVLGLSFVDATNPITFIEFLEDAAQASGVTIAINLLDTPAAKQAAQTTTRMQIIVRGRFLPILELLEKMEHGPYLVSTETVTIKKSFQDLADPVPAGSIEATFTIEVSNK